MNRDPAIAALNEDDRRNDQGHHHQQDQHRQEAELPGANLFDGLNDRSREIDDNPREDNQRHPVPDAALGDLLAKPHDEARACRERQHRHQPERQPGMVDERESAGHVGLPFEEERDAHRLHDAQENRAVTGVLRDLPASELAFLRELLEVRPHNGQQLQNDRRADVRHDAEREDRHLRQIPAREHVVETEHLVLHLVGEL